MPFTLVVGGMLSGVPKFRGLGVSTRNVGGGFNLLNRPLFLNVLMKYNVNTLSYGGKRRVMSGVPCVLNLNVGVKTMVRLVPHVADLFVRKLGPVSSTAHRLVTGGFGDTMNLGVNVDPTLIVKRPTALIMSLLLVPIAVLLTIILPNGRFLPLTSLTNVFCMFPLVLPVAGKGMMGAFVVNFIILTVNLCFMASLTPCFAGTTRSMCTGARSTTMGVPSNFRNNTLSFTSDPFS